MIFGIDGMIQIFNCWVFHDRFSWKYFPCGTFIGKELAKKHCFFFVAMRQFSEYIEIRTRETIRSILNKFFNFWKCKENLA